MLFDAYSTHTLQLEGWIQLNGLRGCVAFAASFIAELEDRGRELHTPDRLMLGSIGQHPSVTMSLTTQLWLIESERAACAGAGGSP